MRPGRGAVRQIAAAFGFALRGLAAAWRHEAAFRQELAVLAVAVPVALYVGSSAAERALLVASVLLVPLVELINTAIETAVDRVGESPHPLAARAKDVGSAAVLTAIALAAAVWGIVLLD